MSELYRASHIKRARSTKAEVERRHKKATPHAASESQIYSGRELAGTVIVERKGRVTALDASGKRIRTFRTDREAMTAILDAARRTA